MSFIRRLSASLGCACMVISLAGCGGGSGNAIDDLRTAYSSAMSGLTTPSVLTGSVLQDLFDLKFLDSGSTRADTLSALAAEASALQAGAGYSSVPQVALSNIDISDCRTVNGEPNVCTLTATLTNSDADTTSVTFSTLVRQSDGKLRLYGDQSASAN